MVEPDEEVVVVVAEGPVVVVVMRVVVVVEGMEVVVVTTGAEVVVVAWTRVVVVVVVVEEGMMAPGLVSAVFFLGPGPEPAEARVKRLLIRTARSPAWAGQGWPSRRAGPGR